MTQRIRPYSAEITIPNTTGAASSVSGATCVRLVNISNSQHHVVSVVDAPGGNLIGSFTIIDRSETILEKQSGHYIYVDGGTSVLGTKVGFTN